MYVYVIVYMCKKSGHLIFLLRANKWCARELGCAVCIPCTQCINDLYYYYYFQHTIAPGEYTLREPTSPRTLRVLHEGLKMIVLNAGNHSVVTHLGSTLPTTEAIVTFPVQANPHTQVCIM